MRLCVCAVLFDAIGQNPPVTHYRVLYGHLPFKVNYRCEVYKEKWFYTTHLFVVVLVLGSPNSTILVHLSLHVYGQFQWKWGVVVTRSFTVFVARYLIIFLSNFLVIYKIVLVCLFWTIPLLFWVAPCIWRFISIMEKPRPDWCRVYSYHQTVICSLCFKSAIIQDCFSVSYYK